MRFYAEFLVFFVRTETTNCLATDEFVFTQ